MADVFRAVLESKLSELQKAIKEGISPQSSEEIQVREDLRVLRETLDAQRIKTKILRSQIADREAELHGLIGDRPKADLKERAELMRQIKSINSLLKIT